MTHNDSPISMRLRLLKQKWSSNTKQEKPEMGCSVDKPEDRENKENLDPSGSVGTASPLKEKRSFFSLRKPTNSFEDINKELNESEDSSELSEPLAVPALKELVSWYVGDLDKRMTEGHMRAYFGVYPGLISVKIPKDLVTGASLGYGYVNYDTKGHANDAREALNYSQLGNSEIRILPSIRNKTQRETVGCNVFVSNLPDGLNTRAVYKLFKKYGSILSCKYVPARRQAFVLFEKKDQAESLIAKVNNTLVGGDFIFAAVHLKRDELEKRVAKATSGTASPRYHGTQFTEESSTKFSIFIRNLPLLIDDQVIKDLVEPYACVQSVHSRQVPQKGGSWALVALENAQSVSRAIAGLNSFEVEGRRLFVTKAVPREEKDYAKREGGYPKKKLKILVTGLDVAHNKEQFEKMAAKYKVIRGVELYGNSPGSSDYGYIELDEESGADADDVIDQLKTAGCSCYKVNIQIPNQQSNYNAPKFTQLVGSGPSSAVSVSYVNPTKLYKINQFNSQVAHEKRRKGRQDYAELRRRADEIVWELAVRLFSPRELGNKELTAVKVHSLTQHVLKFFWVNKFDEFWQFLEKNAVDGRGRVIFPPHSLLQYQLLKGGEYLGMVTKRR